MELHEFMCPEVVSPTPPMPTHSEIAAYPNRLIMACDTRTGDVLTRRGSFRLSGGPRLEDFGPHKPRRNHFLVTSLMARAEGVFVADLGDAAAFDSTLYFDRPRNVIQYNRRKGMRNQVLWRLPGYFEPTSTLGGLWQGAVCDDIPFAEKESKVFWRGSLSGSHWKSPFAKEILSAELSAAELGILADRFSRVRIVLFSAANRDFTDFRISVKASDPRLSGGDDPAGLFDVWRDPSDFLGFKYILCPTGHDVPSQLYWVIGTNSVAFREECDYEVLPDFFLKPWVHYVPLERGMRDLSEKFEFCERNAGFCEDLSGEARLAHARMMQSELWDAAEETVLDRLGIRAA